MRDINRETEDALDSSYNMDDIIFKLEYLDFSDNKLSSSNFTNLFDGFGRYPFIKDESDKLKVLKKVVKQGLNLNALGSEQFSYGHILMRQGTDKLIDFAFSKGFDFDSYTTNNWHSLELIQLNYFAQKADKDKFKQIINTQLAKGIDLSKTDPVDFFTKLNRHHKSEKWNDLVELYRNDSYMNNYFSKHVDVIVKHELFHLIPSEAADIFIF